MKKYGQFIYTASEWMTKFALANLLWLLFTLTGLIIFGLIPSTVALYTVIRKWIQGKTDIPVVRTYWQIYKQEFIRANQLLLAIIPLLFLAAIDMMFLFQNSSFTAAHIPVLVSLIFFTLFYLYLVPGYVHFDITLKNLMKNAFLIMMISPLHDLLLLISLISLIIIFIYVPGIPFFFGMSSIALINVLIVMHAFNRISRKKHSES